MFDYEEDEVEEIAGEQDSLFEHHRVVADKGQSMMRVDKFMINHLEKVSRTKIQEAADNGFLFVNGKSVKSNYKVKPNDVVTMELEYPRRELRIIAQDIPIDIIYEDDVLMVVNKPAGLCVHPGHGNYSGTLVNALAWHLRDNPLFNDENDLRPGLVHRIDKDTSGLLVIAKDMSAKVHLAKQFFDKTSQREYHALVWGVPSERTGTISGFIGRNLKDRKTMDIFDTEKHGKWAVTHYEVVEEFGYVSLVRCKLETGRTHQIRAHFQHIGHPLFSDDTYGGNRILRGTTFTKYRQFVENCFKLCPRQALHAKTLGFEHPKTGEMMQFNSELPDDMQLLISKWRGYISQRPLDEPDQQ